MRDDDVTCDRAVRETSERMGELERPLGRTTLGVEFLKKALAKSRPERDLARAVPPKDSPR